MRRGLGMKKSIAASNQRSKQDLPPFLSQVRIKPEDEKGIENLSQYIIRNTFSNSTIKYVERTETVLYSSKMSHGKNKKNFQVFDPLEFIAAIIEHIPEKSFQLIRYYGFYLNRMRGDQKKQGLAAQRPDQTADEGVIDIRSCKKKQISQFSPRKRYCGFVISTIYAAHVFRIRY